MKINAISFAYAARFVCPPKEEGRDHLKGILFEPQKSGIMRLVATNGRCVIIVHDGTAHVDDEPRRTWINPHAPGLLSAAKKGDIVTIRPDGIVEVEKGGAVIYVSPRSCEDADRLADFPSYEQVVDTRPSPKTRNYSLNTKYLSMFDLGDGVTCYPTGGNLDPLIVQPCLKSWRVEIESALGILMPVRAELDSSYTPPEEYIKTFINRE